jgi:ribonuclease E
MPNKMLIDASHPEETRVVVVRGNRIEEFDFESQDKKQLKGNIYLARVTRVEPSLQAAFVEYGGNRHGFLAFSEIHPDYYQIPVADRQALLRAEAEEAESDDHDESDDEERHERGRGRRSRRRGSKARPSNGNEESAEALADSSGADEIAGESEPAGEETPEPAETAADEASGTVAASADAHVVSEAPAEAAFEAAGDEEAAVTASDDGDANHDEHGDDHHEIESVGAEDALEEVRNRRKPVRRQYKIQEVIKRRQILLVQVVKEERGNKGAALTTYLSLAGRYSVLMPNTARGGGISRKITNVQDRKRLKEVVADLEVPQGMGVILRTAGESRTKAEIKRDYEYLMRLWENVRNLTLQSTAPALVYEEGSLIKRSVRDLYNKDIDEILVSGEDGYREAKDFMRMLMPSHAKVVQPYREATPILVRSGIEAQLDRMLQPQVTLKSGGYLIINQTEALVAIDVNSGRSTKEHSIEETALHTNLEAAEEVSRQLRLRDLAGLIVIDFIDMEENRNNRAVEKKLKDCLKNDRARIQVGRISHFGLMEMSRQRIRASVLESTMKPCPHCGGTGHVRSDSSVALTVVRGVEEFLLKDSRHHITVRTPTATALYVLNHKRSTLVELENRFGLTIAVEADDTVGSQYYVIARGAVAEKPEGFVETPAMPVYAEEPEDPEIPIEEDEEYTTDEQSSRQAARPDENGEGRDRKRRRRRRRRGGRDREHDAAAQGEGDAVSDAPQGEAAEDEAGDAEATVAETPAEAHAASGEETGRKRRRGKRGGKRNQRDAEEPAAEEAATGEADADGTTESEQAVTVEVETVQIVEAVPAPTPVVEGDQEKPAEEGQSAAEKPKKPRRTTRTKKTAASTETASEPATEHQAEATPVIENEAAAQPSETEAAKTETAKPRRARRKPAAAAAPVEPVVSSIVTGETVTGEASTGETGTAPTEEKPKRAGWWQRKGFF